jgi:hypothetical protein
MNDPISIRGPVEMRGGELALSIPLEAGGKELAPLAQKISKIEGDYLVIPIPDWLASKLKIQEGSFVDVDNKNGKFTITRVAGIE